MKMSRAVKAAQAEIGRAHAEFVAEIQQIAADVGVTLTEADIAELELRAGEERRPFAKVFREALAQRLTGGRIVTGN